MHLVVTRDALAAVVVEQARGTHVSDGGRANRQRAADQPQPMRARLFRQKILYRTAAVDLSERESIALRLEHTGKILRQDREPAAGARGGGDEATGLAQVGVDVGTRGHLDRRRTRRGGDAVALVHSPALSRTSSTSASLSSVRAS